MSSPRTVVHDTPEALAATVAADVLDLLADVQAAGGIPQIVLTGGTIAEAMHREIARQAPASGVDWGAVIIWFGDERFVAADSPDRNAGQARAAFLDAVGAHRVHEMPASSSVATAEESAALYRDLLGGEATGRFDLVMLGIGPDGHVASLFPEHPELAVDDVAAAAVHDSPKPPPDRVTMTFARLNAADRIWLLASGESKAEAVARARASSGSIAETPARGILGSAGTQIVWHLDQDAARPHGD
ncbi:6-phosphogluconolactonase [Nocardioides sp. R-C-SC26]|uniref:6-phosphogluconolactonase n=1 Tax=Nocardioides sp. R-C-SC26 TaxID=2870414 RepID=UPI001E5196F1|nr:6-phosphogluconolactonase [Nocardioides sp. R-C-SC26]